MLLDGRNEDYENEHTKTAIQLYQAEPESPKMRKKKVGFFK